MVYGKKLPIGVDDFEKLIREDFYYVDKTEMIVDLLRNWGEVNLFTRPRRFGKSLNMNMLKSFFEIGCDKNLFKSLTISKEKELCETYMVQFTVIFISLKGVEGQSFEAACKGLANIIGMEALRFSFLKDSSKLTEDEKALYSGYTNVKEGDFVTASNIDSLVSYLKRISKLL